MPAPLINTVGCATATTLGQPTSPQVVHCCVLFQQRWSTALRTSSALSQAKLGWWDSSTSGPHEGEATGLSGLDLQRLVCPPDEFRLHALQFRQRRVARDRFPGIGRHVRIVLNE